MHEQQGQHIALPQLLNAPRNGNRRMAALEEHERPLGPDDLPIERHRSAEDQALAAALLPQSYTHQVGAPGPVPSQAPARQPTRQRQASFLLRMVSGRLSRGNSN